MRGPDWVPVPDSLDVMPHAIAVDYRSTGGLRDGQHAAVDVGRDSGQHLAGRSPQARRPGLTNQVVIAADPPRGDDHRLGMQLELADRDPRAGSPPLHRARFEHGTAHAINGAAAGRQCVDSMTEHQRDPTASNGVTHTPLEGSDDTGPSAPRDVKAWDRIPGTDCRIGASLGPAHDGKESNALCVQPRPLLARRKREIGVGPVPWPLVFLPIEAGGGHPVLERQLMRVADAEPPLLWRVDKEQTAKGPEGLPAQPGLWFLLEQNDAATRIGQFGGRHQPGETRAHHNHISVGHSFRDYAR
ncbi:MAG: hypothetical protein QOJ33_919 [Chloroflexota bacterium]|nr:hypothetical protein [Chloroflexota bacterium]